MLTREYLYRYYYHPGTCPLKYLIPSECSLMSVFQLQEWWSVKVAENEEFDHGCMVIGNLDNSKPPAEKIAVGSQQGMLRIYAPSQAQYRVEDLILEESLDAPILQLLAGRFIPSVNIFGLAVLHPKQLMVYELIPEVNKDGRVNYYSLRKAYSHDLGTDGRHFTAYNMFSGAFGSGSSRGKSDKREMIIVQSLDGKLQIFEQSANSFTQQIVDCLLPGPISYVPKIDAFVTVNHACTVECYRYQVLANMAQQHVVETADDTGAKAAGAKAGEGRRDGANSSSSSGQQQGTNSFGLRPIRPAMVEWSLHVGEPCRQILEGHFSTPSDAAMASSQSSARTSELLVLCDKTLCLLKGETGGLMQQRRLERSDASCMCVIPNNSAGDGGTGGGTNFILAGQDATVQVYSGFNLVWAAKVPSGVPVQMAVPQGAMGEGGGKPGLIVCINEEGYLSVNYLGTKPPASAVMKQVRELDYDLVESEHRALLQVIRDSQSENKVEVTDRMYMRPQLPKGVETAEHPAAQSAVQLPASLVPLFSAIGSTTAATATAGGGGGGGMGGGGNFKGPCIKALVRLYLSYSSAEHPATNVSLTFDSPSFAHVVPKNVILQRVSGVKSTPLMVKAFFYATQAQLCKGLEAVISASYMSHNGEPRVTSLPLQLPLFLACKPRAPVKAAQCKVVLDTEHPAQPLTELFGDFLYAYQTSGVDVSELLGNNAVQAMGFQMFAPNPTTAVALSRTAAATATATATTTAGAKGNNSSSSPQRRSAAAAAAQQPINADAPAVVSILVSKNAGRYRVQSDSYPAMYIILEELDKRLNTRLAGLSSQELLKVATAEEKTNHDNTGGAPQSGAGGGGGDDESSKASCVKCDDPLPLEPYFAVISAHFAARQKIQELTTQLNDVAHQYRMIEKRLLVRYKDRNPTPLGGLDFLMTETYKKIIRISDEVEAQQESLRRLAIELEGFSKYLALVAGLKYRLTRRETALLRSYLNPDLTEGLDQGWEETVNASLMYLLKTTLAKTVKENASLPGTQLELPDSIEPLKKHLLILFDRLEKGGRLVISKDGINNSSSGAAAAGDRKQHLHDATAATATASSSPSMSTSARQGSKHRHK